MIEGHSLRIRTIESEDLPLLKLWDSQEGRGSYQEFHFTSTVQYEQRFADGGYISDHFQLLMIEATVDEPTPIGLIYISFVREGLVHLGLVICEPSARGKGFGAQATRLIVRHLFENYPLARIEAETDYENIGAQKVLEAAGFTREGTLRSYRYHHHEWRDFVMYSILTKEALTDQTAK